MSPRLLWARHPAVGGFADQKGNTMHIVGVIATAVVVVGALAAAALAVKSVPELQHYLRLRNM